MTETKTSYYLTNDNRSLLENSTEIKITLTVKVTQMIKLRKDCKAKSKLAKLATQ